MHCNKLCFKIETLRSFHPFSCLVLLSLLCFLGGCAQLNCTSVEKFLGGKTNLVTFSYKIADQAIDSSHPPLAPRNPNMPVLITTFVDNNDLTRTSKLGRLLQDHIKSRFVQRGYTIQEYKLGNTLFIEPKSGETILTRDLSKLEGAQNAQAILVGTYSRTNRTLYISTRLVTPLNNNIIASNDYKLCMDRDILDLFNLQLRYEDQGMIDEPSQPLLNKIL